MTPPPAGAVEDTGLFYLFNVSDGMKTSNSIALKYEDITIHFTDDAWFNATEVAAKYGKKPIAWMRLSETDRYLKALCKRNEVPVKHFVVTVKGGNTSKQGTWLHPKLAIIFARWLSPDFAVWCDEQIEKLLRGTHAYSNPPREQLCTEKRKSHHVMMDTKKFTLEEILGLETSNSDFIKENFFCNRALTGEWKSIDESTLDNYDLRLLKAIRDHNAVLIPHYPSQTKPGADGRTRKDIMDVFVSDYRVKRPRLYLIK